MSGLQAQLEQAQRRVDEAAAEADAARRDAAAAQTVVLEMERLHDDNAVLADRLGQTEFDLRWEVFHMIVTTALCCD